MEDLLKKVSSRIKIGNTYVGEGAPVFFIAEIGNNHNGDYHLAKRTIEEAVKAGANAVKLQKRSVQDVFAREMLNKPQTKDEVLGKTYGEYRKSLELSKEEFLKLKGYSEAFGVPFFATPFDPKSVDFLEDVGVDMYKIASFDVTNTPLLEYVSRKGKPIFLSSGMVTIEELDNAVKTILQYNNQLIINHCVTAYPTPDDKLNLATIPFLKKRYRPIPIGYSGHEGDILPSIAAVSMGAKTVERHITIDKRLPGPDHGTVSIEPDEFRKMVESARRIESAWGIPRKGYLPEEEQVRNKHGKSLVSRIPIKAGTPITADMLTFKSPGYGIKPYDLQKVLGKTLKKDIEEDSVITDDHVMW
ncbi:MAG: N-acetylneuraminate synthase family protein [Candidatus Niyogibacteria bacterium]|nr:N-acetylneuraminate synthase family protein [Candidatus Niyogibacteria bacterium]